MGFLQSALRVGGQAAGIAGQTLHGYQQDQAARVKQAMIEAQTQRDAENDRIRNAFVTAQTAKLNAPPAPELEREGGQIINMGDGTATPITGYTPPTPKPDFKIENGQRIDVNAGTATPIEGYTAPTPQASFTPVTLDGKDGAPPVVKPFNTRTGQVGDAIGDARPAAGSGSAAMMKARATNASQLAVIDDALKELDAHPDAVGLMRGLPVIGDRLDPRADPKGVAARAQIANIGSLKIHDRSGAAVSVSEFPRLAPFIPGINDPPEAIRTKLAKLRAAIQVETEAMGGAPLPAAGGPPGGVPSFEDWLKSNGGPPDA